MALTRIQKEVLSSDKKHLLVGTVYVPEGKPKGIIQIVHGMQEYMQKYDELMTRLSEEGYLAFGYDQLGHGLTADKDGCFSYFAKKYGWVYLLYDVAVFSRAIRSEYGMELPYTLMGFSMGSFLVRLFAAKFDWQDRLIIMGTSDSYIEASLVLSAIKKAKWLWGDRFVSKSISKMIFSPFNRSFPRDGRFGWLSSLPETRKAYENDPFCSYSFTLSAMEDIVQLCVACNKGSWYHTINKTKPILLLSGGADPLGKNGSGIRRVYQQLKNEGIPTEMKLYEGCRHIILKEPCQEEVTEDILSFLSR